MDKHEFPNPIRLIRYGSNHPLPEQHSLKAGPLTMLLENGTLKYIRCGEHELIRQIYAAVRNESWGTVLPQFTSYTVEQRENSFSVHFEAEHKEDPIDFIWRGHIEGDSNGTLRYSLEGMARETFMKNRIGFCILHPMEMAGLPVEVGTTEGQVSGIFPLAISPHQPFTDITSMKMKLAQSLEFELLLEGDIFEMEDQRNWSDASYKTYCTPLAIPYPVEISKGDPIKQTIVLKVKALEQSAAGSGEAAAWQQSVQIEESIVGLLPALGLLYTNPLNEWEREQLSKLHLAHLRIELNIQRTDWLTHLLQAADEAGQLGTKLEIEALVGDHGEGLLELLQQLKEKRISPDKLLLFARSSMITTEAILKQALIIMEEIDWIIKLGGGSRLYFTELNRSSSIMPFELVEAVHYPTNPQVHAFDNESMVETLAAQAVVLQSAKEISGKLPVLVGPITLFSRINKREEMLHKKTDQRQMSLFGAGWTLGSVRNLSQAGAAALTYYEITGQGGIMDRDFGLFPVYHLFAEIGKLKKLGLDTEPIELLKVTLGDPLKMEALAIKKGARVKLLIANLRNESQQVKVAFPIGQIIQVRMLDEKSAIEAMSDSESFGIRDNLHSEEYVSELKAALLPYAICILDINER